MSELPGVTSELNEGGLHVMVRGSIPPLNVTENTASSL